MSSRATGRPMAFGLAVAVVLAWVVSGPLFGFSDSWQLVINTSTTIVTFLMVFLIQNTQYRDAEAVQVKLDELLRTTRGATVAGSIHPTVDAMGRLRCGMLALFHRVSHCPEVLAHLRGSLMSERQKACLVFRARLTCPHHRRSGDRLSTQADGVLASPRLVGRRVGWPIRRCLGCWTGCVPRVLLVSQRQCGWRVGRWWSRPRLIRMPRTCRFRWRG